MPKGSTVQSYAQQMVADIMKQTVSTCNWSAAGVKSDHLCTGRLYCCEHLSGLGVWRLFSASAFPGPEVLPNFFCSSAAAASAAAFCEAELADMAGTVAADGLVFASALSCATCTISV